MAGHPDYITANEYATWLTPRAVRDALSGLGYEVAITALLGRLQRGSIAAVAAKMQKGNDFDWAEYVLIPAPWWSGPSVHNTVWSTGDTTFSIGRDARSGYGAVAYSCEGLRFNPAHVAELVTSSGLDKPATKMVGGVRRLDHFAHLTNDDGLASPAPQTPILAPPTIEQGRGPRGGRPPKPFWDEMWASMAMAIFRGELIPKRQADVERAMAEWLTAGGHDASEAAVRERAKALWRAWEREAKN